MFKGKTAYYLEWKKLRAVATECLNKGYYSDTNRLYNALENYFYGFCKTFYLTHKKDENGQYECKTDIISLRLQFEQEHPELAAKLLMK